MKQLLILCSFFLFALTPSGEWELKTNKNGVNVYTKKCQDPNMHMVKSDVVIKASAERIKSVLFDINNLTQWVYNCTKSEIVSKISNMELSYYQVTSVPFPATDRDMEVSLKATENPNEIIITLRNVHNKIPVHDDYVRIEYFESIWTIKKGKSESEVINEVTINPGGSLPNWIINSFIANGPYQTMLHLREIAEKQ